jgi:hypothetical protein
MNMQRASLVVEPFAGLGNRMRAVASAVVLARAVNRDLDIVWMKRPDFNAAFDELFDSVTALQWARRSRQTDTIRTLAAALCNRFAGVSCCVGEHDFPEIWRGGIDLVALARDERRLLIRTCQELGRTDDALAFFKPIASLRERIDAITSRFCAHTIGVHVRGTDHPTARIESPLSAFTAAMDSAIARDADVRFFLCTDEPSVERDFVARYRERVVTHPKTLNRNTLAGIHDAVIDLFALSRTRQILGTHWSSFSDVAARVGNVPLEVVRR